MPHMKQSYTDYLDELCGNRMDVLETLITSQYRKFKKFYKIMKKHSSEIAHMAYRIEPDSDSLSVDITVMQNIDPYVFMTEIESSSSDNYVISSDVDSKVIYFSIQ